MPIRPYLDRQYFDPETVRALGVAFEIVNAALKVEPDNEAAKTVVAGTLIELAKQGVRDPTALSDAILG